MSENDKLYPIPSNCTRESYHLRKLSSKRCILVKTRHMTLINEKSTTKTYQVAEKRAVLPLDYSFHGNFELSRVLVVDIVPDGGSGLFHLPLSK